MDADANKSAAVPAKILWIETGVTFSNYTNYDRGALDEPIHVGSPGNSSRVPYLAPSIPGHTYVALIYQSPANFSFPSNFPYSASFRDGFNVTRIGADFGTPLLEANYFTIRSNATASASASASASYGVYKARPTEYAPTASAEPFLGSANIMKGKWIYTLLAEVVAMIVL